MAVTHKQRFVQKSDSLSRKELKMSPLQLQSMAQVRLPDSKTLVLTSPGTLLQKGKKFIFYYTPLKLSIQSIVHLYSKFLKAENTFKHLFI